MDLLFSLLRRIPTPDLRPKDLQEFHDAVYKALEDGKLTDQEIEHLETMREQFGLSEDALMDIRQELYASAVQALQKKEELSEDDWQHMEQIQDYLGLEDADIRSEKHNLRQAYVLSEIKNGNLPVQTDILYSEKEPVHWVEPVYIYETNPSKTDAINLGKGRSVRSGEVHVPALKGWKKAAQGKLIITSRHIMIKSDEDSESFTFRRISDAECFATGVRLYITRHDPIVVLYKEKGNQDIVASILFTLLSH